MSRIDLNQLRAARAEQAREPHVITVGEPPKTEHDPPNEFTVPHDIDWPVEVSEWLGRGDLRRAMQVLVGDQWEQLKRHNLTMGDINDLFNAMLEAGGVADVGEASASNGSSPTASPSSRPTSNGSTDSTSAKRSPRARAASQAVASPT